MTETSAPTNSAVDLDQLAGDLAAADTGNTLSEAAARTVTETAVSLAGQPRVSVGRGCPGTVAVDLTVESSGALGEVASLSLEFVDGSGVPSWATFRSGWADNDGTWDNSVGFSRQPDGPLDLPEIRTRLALMARAQNRLDGIVNRATVNGHGSGITVWLREQDGRISLDVNKNAGHAAQLFVEDGWIVEARVPSPLAPVTVTDGELSKVLVGIGLELWLAVAPEERAAQPPTPAEMQALLLGPLVETAE